MAASPTPSGGSRGSVPGVGVPGGGGPGRSVNPGATPGSTEDPLRLPADLRVHRNGSAGSPDAPGESPPRMDEGRISDPSGSSAGEDPSLVLPSLAERLKALRTSAASTHNPQLLVDGLLELANQPFATPADILTLLGEASDTSTSYLFSAPDDAEAKDLVRRVGHALIAASRGFYNARDFANCAAAAHCAAELGQRGGEFFNNEYLLGLCYEFRALERIDGCSQRAAELASKLWEMRELSKRIETTTDRSDVLLGLGEALGINTDPFGAMLEPERPALDFLLHQADRLLRLQRKNGLDRSELAQGILALKGACAFGLGGERCNEGLTCLRSASGQRREGASRDPSGGPEGAQFAGAIRNWSPNYLLVRGILLFGNASNGELRERATRAALEAEAECGAGSPDHLRASRLLCQVLSQQAEWGAASVQVEALLEHAEARLSDALLDRAEMLTDAVEIRAALGDRVGAAEKASQARILLLELLERFPRLSGSSARAPHAISSGLTKLFERSPGAPLRLAMAASRWCDYQIAELSPREALEVSKALLKLRVALPEKYSLSRALAIQTAVLVAAHGVQEELFALRLETPPTIELSEAASRAEQKWGISLDALTETSLSPRADPLQIASVVWLRHQRAVIVGSGVQVEAGVASKRQKACAALESAKHWVQSAAKNGHFSGRVRAEYAKLLLSSCELGIDPKTDTARAAEHYVKEHWGAMSFLGYRALALLAATSTSQTSAEGLDLIRLRTLAARFGAL